MGRWIIFSAVTQLEANTHMLGHTHTHTGLLPAGKSSNTPQVLGDRMWSNAKLYCDLALQLCKPDTLEELFNANKRDDSKHSVTLNVAARFFWRFFSVGIEHPHYPFVSCLSDVGRVHLLLRSECQQLF